MPWSSLRCNLEIQASKALVAQFAAGALRLSARDAATMIRAAWRVLSEAAASWVSDNAPSMGAALAFYTLFSLAPVLLIVVSVAGIVFGEQAARAEVMDQLSTLIGPQSAATAQALLESLDRPGAGIIGTIVGVVALLIGATTVFGELQNALDRVWQAPPRSENASGLKGMMRTRLLSLGLVLGIGFLLMVSLLVSAALAALGKWWDVWFAQFALLANTLNFGVSFALITVLFALIYKWIPRVNVAWRDVWVGAALTSLLFAVGKAVIGIYIGRSGVASPFGAAGSLVVLLLWVYYSSLIFLFGAELTWVYARRHGSLKDLGGLGVPGRAKLAEAEAEGGAAPAPARASPRG